MEKKSKILIVDDEVEIVSALSDFFKLKGYEVNGALSGEEALSFLENASVDLVLLDIRMPGIWGNEVAKIIKQKYPDIRVIILTAFPEEQIRLDSDLRVDGFFVKPIGFQELYNKLYKFLQKEKPFLQDQDTANVMKARVFLINARLLFVEPDPEIFKIFKMHFKNLIRRGENYELDSAGNGPETIEKLAQFKPDILVFNQAYLNKLDINFMEKINQGLYKPKEIAIYNILSVGLVSPAELEKLTKTIQTRCFKDGLIEIKWKEI